jgi:hypothetical protein
MNKPKLHAVEDSEITGAVDSSVQPVNLPADTWIAPRKFLGPRFWKFDPASISFIPMPEQQVWKTVNKYSKLPVLTHQHRKWLLENQDKIPTEYREKNIYFPSDVYIYINPAKPTETSRFIYRMVYKGDAWVEEQVCFNFIPTLESDEFMMVR